MSIRTGIIYPGTTTRAGEVHINTMYIKYTFFGIGRLLIGQILGAVPLLVTSSLAMIVVSLRLRSRLGFVRRSGNIFATLLGVTLLSLAVFLETSGLIVHQHLMFFLDFSV